MKKLGMIHNDVVTPSRRLEKIAANFAMSTGGMKCEIPTRIIKLFFGLDNLPTPVYLRMDAYFKKINRMVTKDYA